MTDKELLELAAEAAGLEVAGLADKMLVDPEHWAGGLIVVTPTGGHRAWNPLTDDGDEARLEAALGLEVEWVEGHVNVGSQQPHGPDGWVIAFEKYADHGGDKQAARRRAGVRAAASLASSRR